MTEAETGGAGESGSRSLLDYLLSGEPGSFVLWALLAYAAWSLLSGGFRGGNGRDTGTGWDGHCDGGGDGD